MLTTQREKKTKLQDYYVEWSKNITYCKLVPCPLSLVPREEENDHSKTFIRKP